MVIKKGIKEKHEILFIAQSLLMAAWPLLLHLYINSSFSISSETWLKWIFFVTLFFQYSIMLFVYYFPRENKMAFMRVLFAIIFIAIFPIAIITVNTKLIVLSTYIDNARGLVIAQMGEQYPLIGAIVSIMSMLSLFVGIKKYRNLKGLEKSQLFFFLTAMFLSGVIIMTFVSILPAVFKDTSYFIFSPLGTIPYLIIVSYSILKYRLFDIKSLLAKLLEGMISSVFICLTIFGVIHAQIHFFHSSLISLDMYLFVFLISPIVVILYELINKFINNKIGKSSIFIANNLDSSLKNFISLISKELDVEKIARSTIKFLKLSLNLENVDIVLLNTQQKSIGFSTTDKNVEQYESLEKNFKLWEVVTKEKIIIYDELILLKKRSKNQENNDLESIKSYMEKNDLSAVVAIETKIRGYILLGKKENGLAFTFEEISYLESMLSNINIALGRVLLYEEVQNFNETLKNKVYEQTKNLEEKIEELEELRKKEHDMLDIMGHELRTPIAIIQNYHELMAINLKKNNIQFKDTKAEENFKKYLDTINKSIKREVRLIDTLLSAAKVTNNKTSLPLTKINLVDIIESEVKEYEVEAKKKSLYLVFEKPKIEIPFVYSNQTKVEEIVDNFISNAIKYTNEGGIKINLEKTDDFVKISFIDTGVGISETDQKRLGEKFFRANQYIKDNPTGVSLVRPGGTGLGLYVSFGYIKTLGGNYEITSTLGKGSTFSFTLPITLRH